MMEALISLDQGLFFLINQNLQNGFLDWLMPYWRNKMTWVPFYILLTIFLLWQYKWKGALAIVMVLITAGIADYTSSSIIKPLIDRTRPCNDPALVEQVRTLINCGAGKSFTSSHATNHFAVAFILAFIFGHRRAWIWATVLFWAAMVGFAQVYVGVHFPGDILGGAALGGFIAACIFLLYRILAKKYNLHPG